MGGGGGFMERKGGLGSPVGAVGLVLRAVNEVKLDRARLLLGWVTRLTVSIGHWLWADQLCP